VSSLPAYHGESVVLRILRPDSVRIGIQNLGFEEDDYKAFQKIIRRPNGIFLVTGPTGSGKTTTLYGALNELNRPDKKIITAEDPVEYNFVGINQCQVKDNIGLSFAKILRTINEGCREIPFPYMSLFIRWCQYLTLIYHIDTNFLEKMSLRNVANSTFCHDWDSDLINYLPDHINTRSPRNAPQFSYVIW